MVVKVCTPGLKLDAAMRMLLMEAMAQYPSQSASPKYKSSDYPDDYCKVFPNRYHLNLRFVMALHLGTVCDVSMNITLIISTGEFQFFLPGLSRIRPKGALRIYNKIGRAYGFTVDNSYVPAHTRNFFSPGLVWMLDMATSAFWLRVVDLCRRHVAALLQGWNGKISFSQTQPSHFLLLTVTEV